MIRVIVCDNYEEISSKAADIISECIQKKPNTVIGLATGTTPVGTYDQLIDRYNRGILDFSLVKTINLDEYYPMAPENPHSFHYYMKNHLLDYVNIKPFNAYIPDGLADMPEIACMDYENAIQMIGTIDLQVLSIGVNGHIGFNEPNTEFIEHVHESKLSEETIIANARFFNNVNEVPKRAITVGINTILNAKKIIVLATGETKKKAVRRMLRGSITSQCPASILQTHSDVTLICDKEAYGTTI